MDTSPRRFRLPASCSGLTQGVVGRSRGGPDWEQRADDLQAQLEELQSDLLTTKEKL
eukprot:COSAG02_NODE_26621_length_629_cov_0.747170_2_plen_56_part_01